MIKTDIKSRNTVNLRKKLVRSYTLNKDLPRSSRSIKRK